MEGKWQFLMCARISILARPATRMSWIIGGLSSTEGVRRSTGLGMSGAHTMVIHTTGCGKQWGMYSEAPHNHPQ